MYEYVYIYIYIYIYRYMCIYEELFKFPKRIKRHSKKCDCNAIVKFDYYLLEKSFSHMNKCVYICTYL